MNHIFFRAVKGAAFFFVFSAPALASADIQVPHSVGEQAFVTQLALELKDKGTDAFTARHYADNAHNDHSKHADRAAQHVDEAFMIGDLMITDAFARATPKGAPVAGGFLTISNHGSEQDTLIGASSDVAGVMELHDMVIENDVMQMFEVEEGISIPAGETVTLAPGGLHLMFLQLKEQLVEGMQIEVQLTFEKAGSVAVSLDVKNLQRHGSMKHDEMKSGEMKHEH